MGEDYVKVAIEAGYTDLGMSDHGPIKPEFMSEEEFKFNWLERQMTYDEFVNVYLPDCQKTKEKYKNSISIRIIRNNENENYREIIKETQYQMGTIGKHGLPIQIGTFSGIPFLIAFPVAKLLLRVVISFCIAVASCASCVRSANSTSSSEKSNSSSINEAKFIIWERNSSSLLLNLPRI